MSNRVPQLAAAEFALRGHVLEFFGLCRACRSCEECS
jgi:Fe2+ or Zn2+ uptake regulation protein